MRPVERAGSGATSEARGTGRRYRARVTERPFAAGDQGESAGSDVVEPFWYTEDRPASVDVIAGWVEAAAERIGADHIDGASRWLDGHYADSSDSWMASDGLHPNDTGYADMAKRMDAALRALDPPL